MAECFICGREQAILKSKTITVIIPSIKKNEVTKKRDTGSYALCDGCFEDSNNKVLEVSR